MGFKLVKEGYKSGVIDEEQDIALWKTSSGQEHIVFELSIKGENFVVSAKKNYTGGTSTVWQIWSVKYPDGFKGDEVQVREIVEESVNAYRLLGYKANASQISVSFEID